MKKLFIFLISIFILFISCNKEKKVSNKDILKQVEFMKKSTEYSNKAIKVIDSDDSLTITQNQMNKHVEFLKKAVYEAKKVDTSVLNKIKNGFGEIYTKKYIEGIEQQIKGYESVNSSLSIKGQILYDEYIDWKVKEGL